MENFKIDRANKTFVFDDGEVLPIPKDKVNQVLRTPAGKKSKQEAIDLERLANPTPFGEEVNTTIRSAGESFFGNPGKTAANYLASGLKGIVKGEGQEELGYVDRVLDHFYAMQEGRKEHLGGLQQRNPTAATIGKGLGFVGELGSLHGIPGKIALPLLGAGQSETSFLEPGEKINEVGRDLATGAVLDKFFGSLGKIAGQRGAQRSGREAIARAEGANAAEIERAAQGTAAERTRFANETAGRQNELQRVAGLQQAENQAYTQASANASDRIAKTLGKQAVSSEVLGVENFIDDVINTSANAATSEANYASKFLRSVFKGNKEGQITGESLKKGMRALDEAILKNEGAAKEMLMEYKGFLSQSLPDRLGSAYAYEKWVPKILNNVSAQVEKNITGFVKNAPLVDEYLAKGLKGDYVNKFTAEVRDSIEKTIGKYRNNLQGLNANTLAKEISETIRNGPQYQAMNNRVRTFFPFTGAQKSAAYQRTAGFQALEDAINTYPEKIGQQVAKSVDRYLPDIGLDFSTKSSVTQNALQKAPIQPPQVPLPGPVAPAATIQPNLQQIPQMPAPQGVLGKLASGLENFRNTGVKNIVSQTRRNAPAAILGKMAGLPVGKALATGAAIGTGARALTSPSAGGQLLRGGLEQGSRGIYQFIDERAQQYPSYNNGILESPQDRRSLTKEIEDNWEIPIEQKAVMQSKINRGKPLQARL